VLVDLLLLGSPVVSDHFCLVLIADKRSDESYFTQIKS